MIKLIPFRAKVIIPDGARRISEMTFAGEPPVPECDWPWTMPTGSMERRVCFFHKIDEDLIGKEVIVLGAIEREVFLCGHPGRQTAMIPAAFLQYIEVWADI